MGGDPEPFWETIIDTLLAGLLIVDPEGIILAVNRPLEEISGYRREELVGQLKAVLGGWDSSDRKFLKPDEITFAVPYEMFQRMVSRWRNSCLTKEAWKTVRKKIELSRKAWKEI